jgi:hypothetical protein
MKDARMVFAENVVPLKAPVDSAGTAYATPYLDLKNALHATIFVYFGVITATSADQNIVVTLEASTAAASNASEVALAFTYRKSGATGANTWTAPAAVASTGLSLDTTTEDGKMIAIDVDPAAVAAAHGQYDARYVRAVIGIDAGGTVTLNAAWAVLDPAYPQATHLSAT